MLTALTATDGKIVLAYRTSRDKGPFVCRVCSKNVVLAYDTHYNVPYFEHETRCRCPLRKKASPHYRYCQFNLLQSFNKFRIQAQAEFIIEHDVCADILVSVNGNIIAIEIERPSLTAPEVRRLTEFYTARNIPLLWILLDGRPNKDGLYRPKKYEREIACLRNGVCFLWRGGMMLTVALHAPHLYYPTKNNYILNRPLVYKRTTKLLFFHAPIPITSLVPRYVLEHNKRHLLAIEPNLIQWPVLEKPFMF